MTEQLASMSTTLLESASGEEVRRLFDEKLAQMKQIARQAELTPQEMYSFEHEVRLVEQKLRPLSNSTIATGNNPSTDTAAHSNDNDNSSSSSISNSTKDKPSSKKTNMTVNASGTGFNTTSANKEEPAFDD
uniref:Uncharacterized protein n=1 Tax=Lygus hesperus TaxID=30085 RepID=A0A0A9W5Q6_LYGHE